MVRTIFSLMIAVILCTAPAAHAQSLPIGTVIVANDKFPAAKWPHKPGVGDPYECYVDTGGTMRVIGAAKEFREFHHSAGPSDWYVPVVFTPRAVIDDYTHGQMCRVPTEVWVKRSKLLASPPR